MSATSEKIDLDDSISSTKVLGGCELYPTQRDGKLSGRIRCLLIARDSLGLMSAFNVIQPSGLPDTGSGRPLKRKGENTRQAC